MARSSTLGVLDRTSENIPALINAARNRGLDDLANVMADTNPLLLAFALTEAGFRVQQSAPSPKERAATQGSTIGSTTGD